MHLKTNVDNALHSCPGVKTVLMVKRTGGHVHFNHGRDFWYHEEMASVTATSPPVACNAEDALFILYTSGSTGKPKGVLHTTGGYLVYASMTHELAFDIKEGDVYWW